MNKLLVVLLAVCLVSVHAFVKRDTAVPAASQASAVETFGKDLTAFGDKIKNEVSKILDPEKIKSDLNAMIDSLNEAVKSISEKEEAPKA